jgi:hypothetical protein
MKSDYLKNILRWRNGWLESVECHFASVFQYYTVLRFQPQRQRRKQQACMHLLSATKDSELWI